MTDLSPSTPPGEVRLIIGEIVAAQGLRGDVRMRILTHFPERIPRLSHVFLGDEPQPRRLLSAHLKGNVAILSIEGVTSRESAEELRGLSVRIALDQASPLQEDEYFYFQLIGLPVYDEAGTFLGNLEEILETGANDVYVIRGGPGGELLLPGIKSVIVRIDLEQGRIIARPLEYYEE
ncbi:ribosome maturation factor RimM [Nitrolancea hollandica]|uniref:Ribosome maturation factor RimM n=1 Tax=Nitrolancea hollandica Lb TaxID=1129897 RepID=I4ECU2_9BACT|nr:ribosome maturation factor RimM [Nitrolancea hollandica]CCF82504.1 Ribosome maturation factor rimM [Nitrolancea hollandica Lb]